MTGRGWYLLADVSICPSLSVLAEMVGGEEVSPPACSWRQGLDVASFSSKNVVVDLNLELVQGQPFVSCVSLDKVSFSGSLTWKMRTRMYPSLRVAVT